MFNFSSSTVLMTVITSNILIIAIGLFLKNRKLLISIGYKLLIVFSVFIIFRFALPFEFPFTNTVLLPKYLSKLIGYFKHPFYRIGNIGISPWTLFEIIWAIGILIGLMRHLRNHFKMRNYIIHHGENVTKEDPYASLLKSVVSSDKSLQSFRVMRLPDIVSPMLYSFGIHYILLPKNLSLSDQYLYYVFSHEMCHHIHRDLWTKNFIRIITIIYWWNPFCYLFNQQTDMVLEMRIDDSLTQANNERTKEYLNCLLRLAEAAYKNTKQSDSLAVAFWTGSKGNLEKRFELLCHQKKSHNYAVNILFTCVTLIAFVLSYTFILEPSYVPQEIQAESFALTSENAYAVLLEDGTYDLYLYDILIENVESLDSYSKDLPIYTTQEKEELHETP